MLNLPLILTQLVAILVAGTACGRVLAMLRQPPVIGAILGGILLGPSGLGAVAPAARHALFPPDQLAPLNAIGNVGVLMFMFVVGLRLDRAAFRKRWHTAVAVSQASLVLPLTMGAGLGALLADRFAPPDARPLAFVLFMAVAMSVTAFPVLAAILVQERLLNTRLGSIALLCAAVDDVAAWCLLAIVTMVTRGGPLVASGAGAAWTALLALLLWTLVPRLVRVWRHRSGGAFSAASLPLGGLAVFALASALLTERLGMHALFGAFVAGLVVPREGRLATTAADRLEPAIAAVLLPVFFAISGLRTDVLLLRGLDVWLATAAIMIVAIGGKLGGSAAAARISGLTWRESIAVGALMNTRGLMELVILNVGLELGAISEQLFAAMVLMALTTTAMTGPVLRMLLPEGAPTGSALGERARKDAVTEDGLVAGPLPI